MIRKIVLINFTILSILLPLTTTAQFAKGDRYIGGVISLYKTKVSDENPSRTFSNKESIFSIQPEMGFFVNDQFVLGGRIGYSAQKTQLNNSNPTTSIEINRYNYIIGLYTRKYFLITEKFLVAIDGNPFYSLSYSNSSALQRNWLYSIGLNINPVFSFFPTRRWAVEAGIGNISFTHEKYLSSAEYKSDKFNLNFGTLGFRFIYFLKRQID